MLLFISAVLAPPASAFDASQTFAKGTYVISAEGSHGEQFNLEGFHDQRDIKFWNLGLRGSILPFGPRGPGGTDLDVREINSDFSFMLWGGIGASVFLSRATAVYAGYRYEHNSNGNTDTPNRGWESHVAVLGMSYYFR
jgi:hypothetical protein